jgi:hypothetical protein
LCFLFQDGDDGFGQKAAYRAFAEPIVLLVLTPAATKGSLPCNEIFGSAFCQNFDNVPPRHIMDSWCGNGATRRRALANRTPLRGKTRSERFRFHALSIGNGGLVDMHQVALSEAIEYLGYETAETDRRR